MRGLKLTMAGMLAALCMGLSACGGDAGDDHGRDTTAAGNASIGGDTMSLQTGGVGDTSQATPMPSMNEKR